MKAPTLPERAASSSAAAARAAKAASPSSAPPGPKAAAAAAKQTPSTPPASASAGRQAAAKRAKGAPTTAAASNNHSNHSSSSSSSNSNPKPDRPPTQFEAAVYALCSSIPRGRVATYGGMSAALARGSARAVGQAMRRNPFAPRVPCHRVVAASRLIGGFSGEAGPCCGGRPGGAGGGGGHVARKRSMLREEGVRFEAEREGGAGYWVVARGCVLSAGETAALARAAKEKKETATATRG